MDCQQATVKMKEMSPYGRAVPLEFRHGLMSLVDQEHLVVALLLDRVRDYARPCETKARARVLTVSNTTDGLDEFDDALALLAPVSERARPVLYLPSCSSGLLPIDASRPNPDRPQRSDGHQTHRNGDGCVMRDYDLLVVGELNPDLILKGNVDPEFGQVEKLVDDFTVAPGGSSSIFAASAARMGLKVLYASRVGDDVFGHYMIDALQAIGIDTRYVSVDPEIKTGATVILSRGEDRAMLTYLGSLGVISQQDVDPAWFSRVRHLHVASPFLLTGLRPYMPR